MRTWKMHLLWCVAFLALSAFTYVSYLMTRDWDCAYHVAFRMRHHFVTVHMYRQCQIAPDVWGQEKVYW